MKRDHAALLVLSTVLSLTASIAADRSIGYLSEGRDLIFQRFSRVSYATPEFKVESHINNLGFRDRDFSLAKTRRFRLMAIGDSFTYGWGVPAEDSWPKILEKRLVAQGYDVEVANLGQPGASPTDYAKTALQAIPLLKPDLVIVGLLQGDDLAQAFYDEVGSVERLKRVVRWLYPHFLEMWHRSGNHHAVDLSLVWKAQAREMLVEFNPDERARFGRIDSEIQSLFVAGQLNPALVNLAVRLPEYLRKPLELESPGVQRAIASLSSELGRIRKASERSQARVIVVSVPLGVYISPRKLETYGQTGFRVEKEMLKTTGMDEAARDASFRAGIEFYEVTRQFREAAGRRDLFFKLDGHFNPAGCRVFAESIEPFITAELNGLGGSVKPNRSSLIGENR
jgi:lysophospholipase L1-like esterase